MPRDPVTGEWTMTEAQKATQFRKGHSGNPGGINQHVRAQIAINAQKATDIRRKMLDALESRIESAIVRAQVQENETVGENGISQEAAERIMALLSADVNRLLADAEDRGYGKPTQPTRDDTVAKKKIEGDMSPEEAAQAYQAEVEGK